MSRGVIPLLQSIRSLGSSRSFQLATISAASLYFFSPMSTTTKPPGLTEPHTWSATPYKSRYSEFPYKESDFARQDPSSDDGFYSTPRFVTHIDDAAIGSLKRYYDSALPHKGRVLDFCSSWVSHYPESMEKSVQSGDLKVVGMGMNNAEFVLPCCSLIQMHVILTWSLCFCAIRSWTNVYCRT